MDNSYWRQTHKTGMP